MQLKHFSEITQQHNLDNLQPEINLKEERANTMLDGVYVRNSSDVICQKNVSKDKHADVIKDFLKKTIAAQSYSKMFSNGANFKGLGIELAKPSTGVSSLYSLQHLNNVSRDYLTKIKGKVQNLSHQEKVLLRKVVDAKLHFRHQSNSNLAAASGVLNINSLHKLQSEGFSSAINTFPADIRCLSNHDFVFFGVEFSGDKDNLPLNVRHSNVDFGANAYIVDDRFPYGYLTLTDHFDSKVPPAFTHEHKKFVAQFSEVQSEIHRKVNGEKGTKDIPMYNTKDMRLGLGLHLIDFLRGTRDEKFKKFALNTHLDDKNLDRILNFVFQPEFHVPRLVSTNDFKEVKLREISVVNAVKASNLEALSFSVDNKDKACEAMGFAIKYSKRDIVEFLFSKYTFTSEDIIKMSSLHETEYLLSSHSADEEILMFFLERGLVDPNKKFRKVNPGETMLDNAIRYKMRKMINLLLDYGAMRGSEIIS